MRSRGDAVRWSTKNVGTLKNVLKALAAIVYSVKDCFGMGEDAVLGIYLQSESGLGPITGF